MAQDGVYVFPETSQRGVNSSIDPTVLLALAGNGGFGGMNNPFWMMFMLPFIYPFFGSMMGGNGWFGGFGGNNKRLLRFRKDAQRLKAPALNSLGWLEGVAHSAPM